MGHASARSGREADAAASRPLTLVTEAVAGGDLATIAGATAHGLGGPVAISVPALGSPVRSPAGPVPEGMEAHARAVAGGQHHDAPSALAEVVAVRIAEQVVGIVAALQPAAADTIIDRWAWLEAAAVAASVAVLVHGDLRPMPGAAAVDELLVELAAGALKDPADFVARSRRLGVELSAGAIALCALSESATGPPVEWRSGLLGAECAPGRLLALVPLGPGADERASELASRLQESGWAVSMSAPRRDAACLHEALREAELLAQLGSVGGHEEIYRLLIGVLLRDAAELERLCTRSIAPLADYDERHDTDLLMTLRAFLAHDGSTTETAEAMALHRHTVGYRLSRVHEVSGLSPYESDGRERLGLGIKARQILDVDRQRTEIILAASTRVPAA
jgi:hypothetical protein